MASMYVCIGLVEIVCKFFFLCNEQCLYCTVHNSDKQNLTWTFPMQPFFLCFIIEVMVVFFQVFYILVNNSGVSNLISHKYMC